MRIETTDHKLEPVLLRPSPFDSLTAQALIAAVQQEYVRRYGGIDETPLDPAEFAAPTGYFVLAWQGPTAVGCGGWRSHPRPDVENQVAEIKRMYVSGAARRRGIARLILGNLERTATAAGYSRLILETGDQQPEAIALYTASGYRTEKPFGLYRDAPESRYFGKDLAG